MISDSVVRASSSLLVHLAEPAARGITLGCLAAIVLGALRVRRVPLRLFAWTTVLYGAVAIALVGWLLPKVPMRVPGAATAERIIEANRTLTSAVHTLRAYAREAKEASQAGEKAIAPRETARPYSAAMISQDARREMQSGPPRRAGVEFRQSSANPAGIREADRRSPRKTTADSSSGRTIHDANSASLATDGLRRIMATESGDARLKAAATNASAATGIPWAVVAAGIYAGIAFLLLARLLLGLVLSHRLARLSERITDADALRKLRFRAYASGLETVPRLAESELVSVPATLSVFRPLILLPAHWREWDEAKLDAILAHEVSHVARRDSLTQRISLIHRAVFWFSPLAWWLDRKLNELAEEASDEAALGAGADKNHYAETLLGFFADLEAASGRVWWQGVSMASDGSRAGHAEKRVERILAWGGSISMKKSLVVALVALAAPVIFLAAAVHPVVVYGQSAQDKAQSDSKNVVVPGGSKAPALPNAPKGGVTAPAALATSAQPALMAVPGAPEHPPLLPGPIADVPAAPGAAPVAPAMAAAPQGGVLTPPMPPTPPVAAIAGYGGYGRQSDDARAVQEVEAQVRAAKKQLEEADAASRPDPDNVREAQEVLKDAEEGLTDAQAAMKEAQEQDHDNTVINGNFNSGWGLRYVMMSANSNEVSMTGSEEDLQHARNLRKKINGDFIWFERDEKSYIITDGDFIAKAKALFAPEEALAKQQDELGRQQDELGRQQDALGEKMDGVKVKIRDITPELEQIRARMKELESTGATQTELGQLQSRLGELQSEVGHSQSEAGVSQSEIGRQQGELGRKQGELGRRQGELGRQEGELAKKASRELRQMFEDAVAKGIAKPE
ncbi:MAG TPA: M56 family metallopeptidase [Candidatus Acidoferrales bacterium]|nr:M56 family metallopeptidase [Candidatus Acidoferrales bacterium]